MAVLGYIVNVEAVALITKYKPSITDNGKKPMPMDLIVTFGIANIYMKNMTIADEMFQKLFSENISEYSDLYEDAANAYLSNGVHIPRVLEIFRELLELNGDRKEVLLERVGDCHYQMNDFKAAFKCYKEAFAASDDDTLTTSLVTSLLKASSDENQQEALALFDKNLANIILSQNVPEVLKKRNVLKGACTVTSNAEETGIEDTVLNSVKGGPDLPPPQSLKDIRSRLCICVEWICLLPPSTARCYGIPILLVCAHQPTIHLRQSQKHSALEPKPGSNSPAIDSLYKEFIPSNYSSDSSVLGVICRLCLEQLVVKAVGEDALCRLLLTVLKSSTSISGIIELCTMFLSKNMLSGRNWQEVLLQVITNAILSKQESAAFDLAWMATCRFPQDHRYWNLTNQVVNVSCNRDIVKQKKLASKSLHTTVRQDPCIMQLLGNCSLASDPRLALGEYTLAYQRAPDDPVTSLCLASGFTNIVLSRTNSNKHHSLTCAVAFFQKYRELRIACNDLSISQARDVYEMEAAYNLGRGFHQLGLLHLAIPSYSKALSYFDKCRGNIPPAYYLCHEAAYNLSLIYAESGSNDLAQSVLEMYNTI